MCCLGKGVAGGDVDLGDFGGKTVDDSLEKRFVGKDDGGLAASGDAVVFHEPGGDVTGLDVVCRGGDDGDILGRFFIGVGDDGSPVAEEVDEGLLYGMEEGEADKNEGSGS